MAVSAAASPVNERVQREVFWVRVMLHKPVKASIMKSRAGALTMPAAVACFSKVSKVSAINSTASRLSRGRG